MKIKILKDFGVFIILFVILVDTCFAQWNTGGIPHDRWGQTNNIIPQQSIRRVGLGDFSYYGGPKAALHINENLLLDLELTASNYYVPGELFRTDGPRNMTNAWRMFTGCSPTSDCQERNIFSFYVLPNSDNLNIQTEQPNSNILFNTNGAISRLVITDGISAQTQGYVGIGMNFTSPQSLLHINDGNFPVNYQVTNNATGATATDGFLMGIDAGGMAIFNQQEPNPVIFIQNGLERMRIRHDINYLEPSLSNINRVSFGEYGPIIRPASLIHYGFPLPNIPSQFLGYREWMDIGSLGVTSNWSPTTPSLNGQILYTGFKSEVSATAWPNMMDAVVVWGKNADAYPPRLRYIYTDGNSSHPASAYDGLEVMRMFTNDGQVGYVGIGENPDINIYSTGTADPGQTLEVNSDALSFNPGKSGLRFTDLTDGSTPQPNPNGVLLSVNSVGDVILVTDQTGGGGTPLAADNGTYIDNSGGDHVELGTNPLHKHTVIPLDNWNLYFTGVGTDNSKVGIGYNATVTPPSYPDIIGRFNVLQSEAPPAFLNTLSTAIYAENSYSGILPPFSEVVGVRGVSYGLNNDPFNMPANIGGKFSALEGFTNIGGSFEAGFSRNSISPAPTSQAFENIGIVTNACNAAQANTGGYYNVTSGNVFATPTRDNTGVFAEVTEAWDKNTGGIFSAISFNTIANDNLGVNGIARGASMNNIGGRYEATSVQPDPVGNPTLWNHALENRAVFAEATGGVFANYGGDFNASSANSTSTNYGIWAEASGGMDNWAGWFDENVTVNGDLYESGNILHFSDSSLKENIVSIENAVDLISELNPESFNYKTSDYSFINLPEGQQYGLVAQDVEKIIPQLVSDYTFPNEIDSLGNEIRPKQTFKALNYTGLIPILVKGVQELDSSVNDLSTAANIWKTDGGMNVSLSNPTNNVLIGTEYGEFTDKLTVEGNTAIRGWLNVEGNSSCYSLNAFGGVYTNGGIQASNNYGALAGEFYGDVQIIGELYLPSDQKLKKDVLPVENATDIISQLQPHSFYFDTDQYSFMGVDERKHYGLVAQEVEQILPELVSDNVFPAKTDSAGNIINPEVNYKSLNYEEIIPLLIQGMKEQQTMIDSLQAQIASFKGIYQEDNGTMAPQTMNGGGDNSQEATLSNTKTIILNQNAPNPFAEQTTITYFIPEEVISAQIVFAESNGVVLNTVDIYNRGAGEIKVYAADLSSGAYIYYLIADGKVVETKTMICNKQ